MTRFEKIVRIEAAMACVVVLAPDSWHWPRLIAAIIGAWLSAWLIVHILRRDFS